MNNRKYVRYVMGRSKKSSIAIISAFTLFVDYLSNVFKIVKKLGGNEQMVYDFFSSFDGASEMAELIVSKTKTVVKKVSRSLSDLIVSLKLGYVNENITE